MERVIKGVCINSLLLVLIGAAYGHGKIKK